MTYQPSAKPWAGGPVVEMQAPQGVVIRVDRDLAEVLVRRTGEQCGSCTCSASDAQGCQDAAPGSAAGSVRGSLTVEARSTGAVRPGDLVVLEVRHFKKVVMLVYVIPLAAFLLPLLVIGLLAPEIHELWKAAAAFTAMTASLLGIRFLRPLVTGPEGPLVEIVRVIEPGEGGQQGRLLR